MRRFLYARSLLAVLPLTFLLSAGAQQERHGRGYKPPPPTAPVTVIVEKAANGKPMVSTSVIFRAMRNDQSDGNLEMKTDGEGHATLDLLEVGSHVTVQVIASGYASYATDFDLTADGKRLLVKLERPRAQVSVYGDGQDAPSQLQPGVQEHHSVKPTGPASGTPTAALPAPASPTGPLVTTPPANTPATAPGLGMGAPASPKTSGSPQ